MNKTLSRFILCLCSLLCSGLLLRGQTVTIGTGTGSGTSTPFSRFYEYSMSESIYLGSEFGGNTGNITAIAYDKASGSSTATTPSVSIYMKLTTSTTVGTGIYPVSLSGYTLVWTGSFPNSASGWQEVTLNTPFPYPSTSQNLSVLVLNNSGAVISSGRPQFRYTTTSVRQEADYTGSSAWTAASSLIPHWERPNARFTLSPLSSCLLPSSVTIGTTTATTSNVSWVASASNPVAYQWEVRSTGQPGSGSAGLIDNGSATGTSVTASNLPPASTSYFYIRTQCSNGDYSLWSGGTACVTPCAPVTAYPWTAGFDNLQLPSSCWTNTSNSNKQWEFVAADAAHGAAATHSGTGMARVDVYNAISANNPMRLQLPPMQLGANMQLQYWTWIGAEGDPAPLSVEVSADGGNTFTTLYNHTNSTSTNQWMQYSHSLSAYAGQTVLIRFKAVSNYGSGSCNINLDDITVQTATVVPVTADSVDVYTQGNIPAVISTLGGSVQLLAQVYPNTVNQSVTWSIIPVTGAAIINTSGLVTAQGNGTVWAKAVSALNTDKKDSLLITISGQIINVDSVDAHTLNNVAAQINTNGGTLQMVAQVYPNTVSQSVSWSIVPVTGAATINANGVITAQSNGTVWAKAVSVQNTAKRDSVLVTISGQVVNIDSVDVRTLNNVAAQINVYGGTLQMFAQVYPAMANQSVSWSIVPVTGAATINANGIITAQGNGTVWAKAVSVQNTAKRDSVLVTISGQAINVDSVDVRTANGAAAYINTNGGTLQLEAWVYPANATQSVQWSVVPLTGNASINSSGLVTALANGQVWAKATSMVNAAKSDSVLILIQSQELSIGDTDDQGFYLYPNPVQDKFVIHIPANHPQLTLLIRDHSGKMMQQLTIRAGAAETYPVDISALQPGLYFLSLEGKGVLISRKLIKN
ncbi:T9SS-dependent choice-of-anchor J family protein [Edaphocola aurantiacus]|uniref:T9SS-dependent choice-of-anchor J family protein n=1 Tax=Edaphocola aurantiacus TaxID=2601682 RepID=UPI001C951D7E|nr:choice-of-anchor J domain-containing protein [Edaphocola aurantiacus]